MRSFFTLALILFSIYVEGQFLSAPGTYIDARNASNPSDREIYIWSEDFADGIPATWSNSGAPALAIWEYRGPATNPQSIGWFKRIVSSRWKRGRSNDQQHRFKRICDFRFELLGQQSESMGSVLQKLKITPVKNGAFNAYMKSKGKLGGQNKIPRLANDRKLADALLQHK